MIQKLIINNFRSFKKLEVEQIQLLNLFAGKNNAGKTSLLEAIYAVTNSQIVRNTMEIRKILQHNISADEVYKNLTHRRNNKEIEIDVFFENYNYKYAKFVFTPPGEFYFRVPTNSGQLIGTSINRNFTSVFLLERKEQLPKMDNVTILYDRAEIEGMKNIFLEAVKVIDEDIEELRTFSTYQNALFYRKKNDTGFYLIDYLGDAARKIIGIIANIVFYFMKQSENEKILLIDEIENGLHYSVQEEFWRVLIRLCIKYRIQLFATTHSKEMLEAYSKVSKEENNKKFQAYFELSRDFNDEIICINHDLDVLEYEIQKNENVRG